MAQQEPAAPVVREQQYGTYASGEAEREITDEMIALAKSRVGAERAIPRGTR